MQWLMIAIGCCALLLAGVARAEEPGEEKLVKLHYSLAGLEPKTWGIVKSRGPQVYAIQFDGKPGEADAKPDAKKLAKERRQMLEEIRNLVLISIEPSSWAGALDKAAINLGDDGLTIWQTPSAHEKIGELLYQFYCLQALQVVVKVETYQVPNDAFERWMLDPKKRARLLSNDERAELLIKEKLEAVGKATIAVPNGQLAQVHAPDAAGSKVLDVRPVIRADRKGVRLKLSDEITETQPVLEFGDAMLVSLAPPDAEGAHRYLCLIAPHVELVKLVDRPWEGK